MFEDQNNRKCEIAKSENMAEAKRGCQSQENTTFCGAILKKSAFNYVK